MTRPKNSLLVELPLLVWLVVVWGALWGDFGFGNLLVGLVLALAVQDTLSNVDLTTVGWIMAAVGLVVILLTAITLTAGRRARTSATTVHPDGSQTVEERRTDLG